MSMTPENIRNYYMEAAKQGILYLESVTAESRKSEEDIAKIVGGIESDMKSAGLDPALDESWEQVGVELGVNGFGFIEWDALNKSGCTPKP